jgi:phosphoenolpyruvate carboxylase
MQSGMLKQSVISTMQVTRDVSLLSRWMAIDFYIRELDSLSFELSVKRCSDKVASLANDIMLKGQFHGISTRLSNPDYFQFHQKLLSYCHL